ncbi:MAG: CHASE domain-containing protein, partial [Verrucomicrobiales bacterium]|nr:CHASE domain-containing protein [Verrucomicrobiales bacterium]
MTLALAGRAFQDQTRDDTGALARATEQVQAAMQEHVDRYVGLVESGQAFFAASDRVTAGDWSRFARGLGVPDRVPGLLAYSYNPWVEAFQRPHAQSTFRAEGAPEFTIHPSPPTDPACPVGFIEPRTEPNVRVQGFDIYSEATRRQAIDEARDSGEVRMTSGLKLTQTSAHDPSPGFLILGPMYASGLPTSTQAERREAFRGVVVVVFRLHDFARAVSDHALNSREWRLALLDVAQPEGPALYQEGAPIVTSGLSSPGPGDSRISVGGRTWRLLVRPGRSQGSPSGRMFPWIVLGGGLVISGLIFALRLSLGATERRARDLATAMTHDLRETRDALRRTAEELAAVLDALPDLFLRIDHAGRILGFHSTSLGSLHQTPNRYVGRSLDDLLPPGTAEKLKASIAEAARTGNLVSVDYSQPLEGSLRHFEARIRPFGSGELVMLTRDITARVRAVEHLAQSEQRFSKAFHASLAGLCIARLDNWTLVDVNDSFLAVFGYTRAEMIGRTVPELGIWADATERHQASEQLRQGKALRHVETRVRKKTGELGVVLHSAELVEINETPCVLSVVLDITERKSIEVQLRESQKMQAIGALAGGIAHDFNNILGSIIGFTELARLASPDQTEVVENLDEVLQASRRAKEVVQQILAFSRRQEGAPRAVNLGNSVSEVLRLLRAGLSPSIELTTLVPTQTPPIVGDPTQIHQLLMNLTTNAAHAMRESGGRLVISVSVEPLSPTKPTTFRALVSPGAGRDGAYVRLRVQDSGLGMTPAVRDRIFEPFYTTKPPGEGTGLGLAVVHGIVRAHRGIIDVSSTPGEGSTFDVYFPIAAPAPPEPAPPPGCEQ